MKPSTVKLRGAWVACLLGAAGCGGGSHEAAPPPSAPEAPGEASPGYAPPGSSKDADDLGEGGEASPPGYAAPAPTASGPADLSLSWQLPAGDASLEQWEAWLDNQATALASSSDCPNACRALGGLERARAKICQLVGSGDPGARCKRARERVAAAKLRVENQCTCPAP